MLMESVLPQPCKHASEENIDVFLATNSVKDQFVY